MHTLRTLTGSDLCYPAKQFLRNSGLANILTGSTAVFTTSAFPYTKLQPYAVPSYTFARFPQLRLGAPIYSDEHKMPSVRHSSSHNNDKFDSAAWACRLANENGYLSWCRNAYLMTGVGVGMLYRGQTQLAELSGYGAMILAVISLSWGTYMFIYNLLVLRKRAQVNMSWPFVMLQITAAIFHCVVYVAICAIFADESDKILGTSRAIDVSEEEL